MTNAPARSLRLRGTSACVVSLARLTGALLTSIALASQGQEVPAGGSNGKHTSVQFELAPIARWQPVTGTLVLTLSGASAEEIVVRVENGSSVPALLRPGGTYELQARIPGYWSFRQALNLRAEEAQRRHRIVLWPLVRVTGTVTPEEGSALRLPESLTIRMEPPPHVKPSDRVPWGEVACPVAQGGQFSCLLPSADLDLTLKVEGFAPVYLWGKKVPAVEEHDLGVFQLKRGASVGGWVAVQGGEFDQSAISIELRRLLPPGAAGAEETARLRRTSASTKPDGRGFFYLDGLAGGVYELEAASGGLSGAILKPLVVESEEQILLREPLRLLGAASLKVLVHPATDPTGRSWSVAIARQARSAQDTRTNARAATNQDGLAVFTGQLPGFFWVDIYDGEGNVFHSTMDVPLGGDEPEALEVSLDFVSLRGTLQQGKEPLEAKIWFGPKHGAPRVLTHSDRKGNFRTVLPRGGLWTVEIEAEEPPLSTKVRVDLEVDSERRATANLHVPDTEVKGRVVDEAGKPVPGATVVAAADREVFRTEADDAGRFRLRALPEGPAFLSAQLQSGRDRLSSDVQAVELEDGRGAGPIELRLQTNRTFSGVVTAQNGPVAAAALTLYAQRPRLPAVTTARTGVDGSFEAQIPGRTESTFVVVAAPGHPLKAFAVPVAGQPVTLALPAGGGALEIMLPVESDDLLRTGRQLVLFQDGLQVALGVVMNWVQFQGTHPLKAAKELRFPAMAAAHYRACLADTASLAAWDLNAYSLPSADCDEGFLPAGGTLELEIAE